MNSAFPSTSDAGDFVEGDLQYLVPKGLRPFNYAYPPPPGVPQNSGEFAARRVRIADGRRQPQRPTLDANGFELVQHASEVTDFSESSVRSAYDPEVDALIPFAYNPGHRSFISRISGPTRRCS